MPLSSLNKSVKVERASFSPSKLGIPTTDSLCAPNMMKWSTTRSGPVRRVLEGRFVRRPEIQRRARTP